MSSVLLIGSLLLPIVGFFIKWWWNRAREKEVQRLSTIWGDNHITTIRRVVIRRRRGMAESGLSIEEEVAKEIEAARKNVRRT